jgi:hypothetical protein
MKQKHNVFRHYILLPLVLLQLGVGYPLGELMEQNTSFSQGTNYLLFAFWYASFAGLCSVGISYVNARNSTFRLGIYSLLLLVYTLLAITNTWIAIGIDDLRHGAV